MKITRKQLMCSVLAVGIAPLAAACEEDESTLGTGGGTGTGSGSGGSGASGAGGDGGSGAGTGTGSGTTTGTMSGTGTGEAMGCAATHQDGQDGGAASEHGHVFIVEEADVTAGVEKTYAIQGGSGHPHSVTLSAADFTDLAGGQTVTAISTTDNSHYHVYAVVCV